ncbi:SSI family serine proteinase inhibitor [Thermomonospora echinospora]|nr:SSI family serine proteinase inhibitor [Thermomonospora echinospora]
MPYRTPLITTAGLACLAVIALAGCGSEDNGGGSPSGTLSPAAQTRLTVEVRPSPQGTPKTWTLTCDPPGGTHPRAAAACQALAKAKDPFKPVPKDAICTEIYGGDQVATVTGTWRGTPVNARFTRLNGCEIDRWEKVAPLFGDPA